MTQKTSNEMKNLVREVVDLVNNPFPFEEFNEEYQRTFRLTAFGYTQKEIAEAQDISVTNVGSRIYLLKEKRNLKGSDLTKDFLSRLFALVERMVREVKKEEFIEVIDGEEAQNEQEII